jgi:hypothetical protein
MNLSTLEIAAQLLSICRLTASAPEEWLPTTLSNEEYSIILQLLRDGQFYVLLALKHSEQYALDALDKLTTDTEYLRGELEEHLRSLQSLLVKVETEEALRRDRTALSTLPPSPQIEQAENYGFLAELRTNIVANRAGDVCGNAPLEALSTPTETRDDEDGGGGESLRVSSEVRMR